MKNGENQKDHGCHNIMHPLQDWLLDLVLMILLPLTSAPSADGLRASSPSWLSLTIVSMNSHLPVCLSVLDITQRTVACSDLATVASWALIPLF